MFWDSLRGCVFFDVPNKELDFILIDPELLNLKPYKP